MDIGEATLLMTEEDLERLKQLAKEDMTQSEIAEELGVSQGTVSRNIQIYKIVYRHKNERKGNK